METLYKKIHDLIHVIKNYDIFARQMLEEKNYRKLCEDASSLLKTIEKEKNLIDYIDEDNTDVSHFIGSLKTLEEQRLKGKLDKNIVSAAYHKSREHSQGFLGILFGEMGIHI